jgi:hypothetical protein
MFFQEIHDSVNYNLRQHPSTQGAEEERVKPATGLKRIQLLQANSIREQQR